MNEINQYIDLIQKICDKNQVKSLSAFGSVTRNQLKSDSDIDLVVDISDEDPFIYADKYFNLKSQLEALFKRPVDLLELKAINNPYLKANIDQSKVLIYGK